MESPILVEILRSGTAESRHRGAVAVVEPSGRVVASAGAIEQRIFIRSTGKPFQMIPAVESGLLERFGFTSEELAIMVASHSGEPYHIELVQAILDKAGLESSDLHCGAHLPKALEAQWALGGRPPSVLHNNCSGQHAGIAAYTRLVGADLSSYEKRDHPSQQRMLEALAQFSGERPESIPSAIDGCSLPTFAVSLASLARAYAQLVNPVDQDPVNRCVSKRIVHAMTSHPRAVAGRGRLCTDLMSTFGSRLIAKAGAEGVYCVGVLPCERASRGLGIAIKIEDGAERALGPVVVETLAQLGVASEMETQKLDGWRTPATRAWRGEITGCLKPVLNLAMRVQ